MTFEFEFIPSMTIQDLKDQNLIIFECISGSKAYGTDTPESDTDIKGIYILPQNMIYGLKYVEQVSDKKQDVTYYELGRFIGLCLKNNPNILEMLAIPADKILYKHPIFDQLTPELFLSKLCKNTFSGYAYEQIKKARGLNKKIVNPVGEKKKSILEFCYVLHEQGSIPLSKWLEINGLEQENCGLVNIPHFKDAYGIYHSKTLHYKGISHKGAATKVLLSSIPKGEPSLGTMHFNEDGYVKYCKDYRDYWTWVKERNPARYENNIKHGKNYDSKNMMHTFRLLDMAAEVLSTGKIIVRRPNREELLSIRRGDREYDDLIVEAENKMEVVTQAYENSPLPDKPDRQLVNDLLVSMRREWYKK